MYAEYEHQTVARNTTDWDIVVVVGLNDRNGSLNEPKFQAVYKEDILFPQVDEEAYDENVDAVEIWTGDVGEFIGLVAITPVNVTTGKRPFIPANTLKISFQSEAIADLIVRNENFTDLGDGVSGSSTPGTLQVRLIKQPE